MPALPLATVCTVLNTFVSAHFSSFSDAVQSAVSRLVKAAATAYDQLPGILPASLDCSHYSYGWEDMSRLVQVGNPSMIGP